MPKLSKQNRINYMVKQLTTNHITRQFMVDLTYLNLNLNAGKLWMCMLNVMTIPQLDLFIDREMTNLRRTVHGIGNTGRIKKKDRVNLIYRHTMHEFKHKSILQLMGQILPLLKPNQFTEFYRCYLTTLTDNQLNRHISNNLLAQKRFLTAMNARGMPRDVTQQILGYVRGNRSR